MRKELQKVKEEIIGGMVSFVISNIKVEFMVFQMVDPPLLSLFDSLYSRAAEKRHIVLLRVRFNGGAGGPALLLHCTPPCCPGIVFFSYMYLLSLLHRREQSCYCVHHAYSLNVDGNTGNLLMLPSDDRS